MGSGGGGSTTTSTKVELPSWAQQPAQNTLTNAYNFSQQPYQQYGGTSLVPMTPQQEAGLSMTENRAINNPLTQASQQQAVDTLQGKYLDPTQNPAFAPAAQRLGDAFRYGTSVNNAAFTRGQAFGPDSSAWNQYQGTQARNFSDSLAQMAGNLYGQERTNQMNVLGITPTLNQAGYQDAQALLGAGDARRSFQQDVANAGLQNWTAAQQYPYTSMSQFANLMPALLGNSGTTSATGPNPNRANPMAGALGGALTGFGVGGPVGALAGAGLGYFMSS